MFVAWQADPTGAVRTASVVRVPRRALFRLAVLAGATAAIWLVCGSATSYADEGAPSDIAAGVFDAHPDAFPALGQTLHPMAEPVVGSVTGLGPGPGLDSGPGTGSGAGSGSGLGSVTVTVSQPAARIASEVTTPVGRRVLPLTRVTRAVSPDELAPAAPLLRPMHGALPARLFEPWVHTVDSTTDPASTGGLAGSVGAPGPMSPAGPSDVADPVVPAGAGLAGAQVGFGRRPSEVPSPDTVPTERWADTPVRPGPARSSAPGHHPGGPVPVPAAPAVPTPVGAAGQVSSNGSSAALPADRAPDATPRLGQGYARCASAGTVRQRADDPSITPD